MKIQQITNQHRRDFSAVYVCEHCNHMKVGRGYDDDNFHRNVIPKMRCPKCGRTAPDDCRPMGTKYAEHEVV